MSLSRLLSVLLVLFTAFSSGAQPASARSAPPKPLTVYFFDVGQGDAALIVSPTGKTVLIDGGPPEAGEHLAARLKQLVHAPLDLVILTHPHLDHLGSLKDALQAVGARRYMDPGFDHASDAYRDLLEFVGKEVGQVMTPEPNPQAPDTFLTVGLGEGAQLTVYWPRMPHEPFLKNTRSDANSNSIVTRITYGKTAFFFTGDSEKDTEETLLRQRTDLTSTVLKVAHHGGKHSSTKEFLAAVKPKAAVISCSHDNEYGHPTSEALERLAAVGAQVFRTDQNGEVQAVSDGVTVTLQSERGKPSKVTVPSKAGGETVPAGYKPPAPAAGSKFVSLKGSEVFHREDCATLKRAKTKERTVYTSRATAARERRPAEDCKP